MSLTALASSASTSLHLQSIAQDALWQMNMRSREQMDSGPYPVPEGEPDCSYYTRTGFCRFGAACRFNHSLNRTLAVATARMKGENPERIGQPECLRRIQEPIFINLQVCRYHRQTTCDKWRPCTDLSGRNFFCANMGENLVLSSPKGLVIPDSEHIRAYYGIS